MQKGPAQFQQAQGSPENPFAHAIPSDMLLDGNNLVTFYRSAEARNALERVFGMGVLAPHDWEEQGTFPHEPRQNNIVDAIAERHHYGDGWKRSDSCGDAAVVNGEWNGSGERRHDLNSLTRFVADIYESAWIPLAGTAYSAARSHFSQQLALASNGDAQRVKTIKQRAAIVDAQFFVFDRESKISPEAAKNVWKFAGSETWM